MCHQRPLSSYGDFVITFVVDEGRNIVVIDHQRWYSRQRYKGHVNREIICWQVIAWLCGVSWIIVVTLLRMRGDYWDVRCHWVCRIRYSLRLLVNGMIIYRSSENCSTNLKGLLPSSHLVWIHATACAEAIWNCMASEKKQQRVCRLLMKECSRLHRSVHALLQYHWDCGIRWRRYQRCGARRYHPCQNHVHRWTINWSLSRFPV
jgi:hypothetical protein